MPTLRNFAFPALELRMDAQMPRLQNYLEASPMNTQLTKAISMLKYVLCDAEGRASISGTNEDRAEIDNALSILSSLESESSPHVVAEPVANRWYLGSLNDGLFIINRCPTPNATDFPPHDDYGPDVVLNVVALTEKQAQEIVDAHNATLDAPQQTAPVTEVKNLSVPEGWQHESNRLVPLLQSFADRLRNNSDAQVHHPELYEADHAELMAAIRHLKQIAATPPIPAPATKAKSLNVPEERAQFEKAFSQAWPYHGDPSGFARDGKDLYQSSHVQAAWKGWQYRARKS